MLTFRIKKEKACTIFLTRSHTNTTSSKL